MTSKQDGMYMQRKKFYVPEDEINRDYRKPGMYTHAFLYQHAWGIIEDPDEEDLDETEL